MSAAEILIAIVRGWGITGCVVALAFVTIGMGRIDEDSHGAYFFRPLIIPGLILLWPVVLWRWWILETDRDSWHLRHQPPRRAHGIVWAVLAVVIVATFVTALSIRQQWPQDAYPIRLSDTQEVFR